MEKERLKELRKKQYLHMNINFIVALFILFTLSYIGVNFGVIMLCLGILIILGTIFKEKARTIDFKLFPYKEELYYYEKERLQLEWNKMHRTNNAAIFIVAIMLILQSLDRISRQSTVDKDILKIMALLMPLYFILINISLFLHIRKIDNDKVSLRGFTRKKLIFSIIGGIIFTGVLIGTATFIIMN